MSDTRNILNLRIQGQRGVIALLLACMDLALPCAASGPPPVITSQPSNQTVQYLGTATFSVSASSGTTMTYQWRKNGANIGGATSGSYTIANTQTTDQASYSVKIVNGGGWVTSSNATLTVLLPPTIPSQPQNQTATQGQSATFSVVASGTAPLSYQWSFGGNPLSGATNAALTITNVQTNQAGLYAVLVTNAYGAVTSSNATLTVYVPPGITTQPLSRGVTEGQPVSFSFVASGSSPFTYQWYFNGSSLGNSGGARTSTLTLNAVRANNAGSYKVVVNNNYGSVTSAVATLTLILPPTITSQPQTETVVQSQDVLLSVVASGTGPLSYQWQATNTASGGFTNLANGGQISGANANVLEISNAGTNNELLYQVIITNACGSVTSIPALLKVVPPVLVDVQFLGTSGTGWPGGSGSRQTGPAILGASGDTWNQEGLTYYIYPGTSTDMDATPLVNSANVASGLTLTVGSSANSVFGGHETNTTPTDPATASLMSSGILQFVLSANVDVWTFTVGGLSGYAGDQFNLAVYAAAPSPRTQTISVTGGASGGNTASALTTSSTDCRLSNGAGDAFQIFTNGILNGSNLVFTVNGGAAAVDTFSAYVNGFQLQIYNSPVITSQPASQTNVAGSNVQFSVGALGGPLGYQWQTNGGSGFVNVGNGGVFSGANSNVLTIASAPGYSALSYQVIVTNNVGSVASAPATLSLTPQILAQPASQAATADGNASFSVVADGAAPLSYQWNCQGTPLAGANNSTLSLNSVGTNNAGNYSVVVQNNCGSVTSTMATLTVHVPAGITTQPASQGVVLGQGASFSVVAGGTAPFSYQWIFNGNSLPGATSSTLTLTSVQTNEGGNYSVLVGNAYGSVTSSNATLAVYVPPTITTQPQNQSVGQGTNASFPVVASGSTPLSYQWSFNGAALSGATTSTLTITNAQTTNAGSYTVAVTNSWGSISSAVAVLTVYVPPTITTQPLSQAVVQGHVASFSVGAIGTANLNYQWYCNGSSLGGGATSSTLMLNAVGTNNAGSYTVVVTNTWSTVTSAVATLTVYVPPTMNPQPQNQAVVQGQTASFSIGANGTVPFSYQWNQNGAAVPGATNAALTLTNVQTTQAGSYTVAVTNNGGSVTSQVATLTVYVPATITSQPQSLTVAQGQAASFSIGAVGTANVNYQWYCNGSSLGGGATSSTLMLNAVGTNNVGSYTVVVNNNYGSVTSAVASLTILVPAGITTQPVSQALVQGRNTSFSVEASGTAPLSYQWYFGGSPLSGATISALTLPNVQTNQAGSYLVVVTNTWGSVTSALATLTVYVPVSITTQPLSRAVTEGQSVSFSVVAAGSSPFTYQWYFGSSTVVGVGGTNSTLTLNNVQPNDAGNYTVEVSNIAGSVTSAVASLTVTYPHITLSAASGAGMAADGFTLHFSVPVGVTYVILSSTDFQVWTPIATNIATNGDIVFTDTGAANYRSQFYRVMVP